MSRIAVPLILLIAATALTAGCASTRTTSLPPAAAIGDCSQLQAEIAGADEARRAALEKQQGAWKAVIPFAVVARYAGGKSEVARTEQRLEELQREGARRGCSADGR